MMAVVLPALSDSANNVRGVKHVFQLGNSMPDTSALHENRRSHLADVEVLPDVERFARLYGFTAAVALALICVVDRAGCKVDKFAIDIGVNKLLRVRRAQGVDIILRQERIRHR